MKPILDADYAGIEARIVCWLAGQTDALDEYRKYDAAPTKEEKWLRSPYVVMASFIFKVPVEKVNKFPQRFVGKETILGCGYGLGPDRFNATCLEKGVELEPGMAKQAVYGWRRKHNRVKDYWYDMEDSAKKAIIRKGEVFGVQPKNNGYSRPKVLFQCKDIEGIPYLLMRLPSGRKLSYPWPQVNNDRISFFGNIKGKTWGRIDKMWGGTLVENCTQAVAADIMAHGAHNVEREGFEVMKLIHDQALAYHDGQTPEEFVRLLTDLPDWAEGLPITAEGALEPFYRKAD